MCHAYCFGLSPCWKNMMCFQLVLNKTFCPTWQPLTYRQLKHYQRTKINKPMFLPPPHRFSKQISQYQDWRANKYSILTVIELGLPVSESSTRISKFDVATDSEYKFNKTKIENWLPIGFTLGSSWLGTGSRNYYTMFNR